MFDTSTPTFILRGEETVLIDSVGSPDTECNDRVVVTVLAELAVMESIWFVEFAAVSDFTDEDDRVFALCFLT